MRAVLTLIALVCLLSGTARAADGRPDPGLMWNRTGLPLTFPLQVKSPPGADYIVTLTDNETDTQALAAYIRGGVFFRVLVPPGTYRLRFDYGTVWHSAEERFAGQKTLHLETPLTFETRGIGRKAGHLVDLTEMDLDQNTAAAPRTQEQVFCQVSRTEIRPNCRLGDDACEPTGTSDGYTSPYGINSRYDFTRESYTRLCD
ncbi:hypothetical protein [Roseovarius confluentis]|jgi:hypothetical protein|uniref:hypothetical protein n=1 Tax=Roseovarius confluentis TaxID=1852027 RepID=UPI001B80DB05|nr:hypothetical protein [Roseovarius confluentis]